MEAGRVARVSGLMGSSRWPILRDAVIISAGIGVARLLSLIFRYLSLRVLTMADYGKLAIIMSGFMTLYPLASFHASHALAVLTSKDGNRLGHVKWVWTCLLISALICLILTPVAVIGVYGTESSKSPSLIPLVFGSLFAIGIMVISQGVARGRFKSWIVPMIELASACGKVCLMVAFIWLGFKSTSGPMIAFLAGPILGAVVGAIYLRGEDMLHGVPSMSRRELGDRIQHLVSFSGFIVLANAITYGMQFVSRSALTRIGFESVAIYDSAQLLYSVGQMMFTGIGLAIVPYVSRADDDSVFTWPWKKVLGLYVPIGLLILVMTVTPIVPNLLAQIGLAEYLSLLPVLGIRMLAMPLDLLFVIGTSIFIGSSRTKEYFLVVLLVAPLHIVGSYFIAPYFGEVGVAIVSVVSIGLLLCLVGWRLRNR